MRAEQHMTESERRDQPTQGGNETVERGRGARGRRQRLWRADVRTSEGKLLATKQESGLAKPGMPRMKCSTFASPA